MKTNIQRFTPVERMDTEKEKNREQKKRNKEHKKIESKFVRKVERFLLD